jgi:hypothetical protein
LVTLYTVLKCRSQLIVNRIAANTILRPRELARMFRRRDIRAAAFYHGYTYTLMLPSAYVSYGCRATHLSPAIRMAMRLLSVDFHAPLCSSVDSKPPLFAADSPQGSSWVGNSNHFSKSSQELSLLGWLYIVVVFSKRSSLHALRISAAFAAWSGEACKYNQGCDTNNPPFNVEVHLFSRI